MVWRGDLSLRVWGHSRRNKKASDRHKIRETEQGAQETQTEAHSKKEYGKDPRMVK